jgi:hypothetical protein
VDYFQTMSPQNVLGIAPRPGAGGYSAAGQTLPPSTAPGENTSFWSPDSYHFWFLALGILVVAGVIGASVDVRAGRRHARASVGD